jgi:hypothetical protein
MLPFTLDQFLAVFVAYNQAVWPAQLLAYWLALLVVVFVIWRSTAFVDGAIGVDRFAIEQTKPDEPRVMPYPTSAEPGETHEPTEHLAIQHRIG